MLEHTIQAYKKFDWLLLGSVLLLTGLGLLALYSIGLGSQTLLRGKAGQSSVRQAGTDSAGAFDDPGAASGTKASDPFESFKMQLTFAVLGLVLILVIGAGFHYRWLAFMTRPMYLGMLLLLGLVLFVGKQINGTRGWFSFGSFGFQPVELAKIVLIVIMAKFLAMHGRYTKELRVVIQSAATVALMILMVVFQPDLGGAIVLAVIWFGMLMASGLRVRHLLTIAAVAAVFAIVSWHFLLRPYQKERFICFFFPSSLHSCDQFGGSYNVRQSVIAIGAGQLTGRGVASGSQSQLNFLPEAKTDFIYSVIAEELGFIGVSILIGLFVLLFSRLYVLAKNTRDDFTLFLIIGTATLIAAETFINIGVASGMMPVTGLTLPFVSYGGSSLLMHFLLIAMMENIAVRRN